MENRNSTRDESAVANGGKMTLILASPLILVATTPTLPVSVPTIAMVK